MLTIWHKNGIVIHYLFLQFSVTMCVRLCVGVFKVKREHVHIMMMRREAWLSVLLIRIKHSQDSSTLSLKALQSMTKVLSNCHNYNCVMLNILYGWLYMVTQANTEILVHYFTVCVCVGVSPRSHEEIFMEQKNRSMP